MKKIPCVLLLVILFSVTVQAVDLKNFSISATIYPNKLPERTNDGWMHNNREWLALDIGFVLDIHKGLYAKINITTYIFATNGFSYAPSSTKFKNEIGYSIGNIKIKYIHFCHHYFHQFENNYNDQDKLVLRYDF